MSKPFRLLFIIIFAFGGGTVMPAEFESDTFHTGNGELKIAYIGHGTLMLEFAGRVIHLDPYSRLSDYEKLPKADLILITHDHRDHLDLEAIGAIGKDSTKIIYTAACSEKLDGGEILENFVSSDLGWLKISAVPAYNLVHKRSSGTVFHPKGSGNGYVLTFADKNIYVAGDTENIPEMADLQNIDIAFLPMNLPYTMTPEMAAEAALSFRPKILYPYHYGDTDPQALVNLLKDEQDIEVRVRELR